MIEKVNPMHPDKIADRIAGAIVDLAYQLEKDPKIAVEVLVGHRNCFIVTESSVAIPDYAISSAVYRIAGGDMIVTHIATKQDEYLAANQAGKIRCGDNGIFKGMPLTEEQKMLSDIAHHLWTKFQADGKYILDGTKLIICQSNANYYEILFELPEPFYTGDKELDIYPGDDVFPGDDVEVIINPLGPWTGGTNVDTGATNRKLGSDMADGVTGGGLHGKDLSKADVSVNIYAFLKAQETGEPVELSCAIGDEEIDGKPYAEIVEIARKYIESIGGFERFAEWGLY